MHACIREKKGRKRFEEEGIEEIASHDSKRNNRKKPVGSKGVEKRRFDSRAKWCPKLGRVGARTARRSVKFPNFRPLQGREARHRC